MTEVASLVLFANNASRTAGFYRAAGVPLEEESHDDGPLHWAAELAGVHVAVYAADDAGMAPGLRGPASTFPGLYVDSLDEIRTALEATGATIMDDHQVRPWGCRFIAEDPDGRAIEINQRSHCTPPPSATVADAAEQESIPLGSSSVTVLATREVTHGSFSLLRWALGEGSRGPDAHFHRSFDEWFIVESGELHFFDGHEWRQLRPRQPGGRTGRRRPRHPQAQRPAGQRLDACPARRARGLLPRPQRSSPYRRCRIGQPPICVARTPRQPLHGVTTMTQPRLGAGRSQSFRLLGDPPDQSRPGASQ